MVDETTDVSNVAQLALVLRYVTDTARSPTWTAPHSRQASALPSVFTKSRRRKAVFRCTNGTSYSEEMEKATECGCANCLL
ncbi:hypothetical protein NHX12_010808 [Muraenolepis orangiensis]|uniref:Uncharacterized protein n=1 Tax=Muraenolepis orangiensis TaxID=630683 RepID=A0A9Q0DHQ6_9TELE|nr:hypothetical protein NHX12_010808 [Muraenolepis orangiensis]